MEKVQHHEASLACAPHTAFEMFTRGENLEKWLTLVADVEARVGGKYELFWDPDDREVDSTIGCRITTFLPDTLLGFDWRGPKKYRDLMNDADPLTHVCVFFLPIEGDGGPRTTVHLVHTGWRSGSEWEGPWGYFDTAWRLSFKRLEELVNRDGASSG